jgi:hypothetical protein
MMLPVLTLAAMITAVAPQNEESKDDGVVAAMLVVAGSTATGALLGGALAGGTSFLALSGACSSEPCTRDNPQLIVTPLAAAAGVVVGAIGGGLLGVVLARALHTPTEQTVETDTGEVFPDE